MELTDGTTSGDVEVEGEGEEREQAERGDSSLSILFDAARGREGEGRSTRTQRAAHDTKINEREREMGNGFIKVESIFI